VLCRLDIVVEEEGEERYEVGRVCGMCCVDECRRISDWIGLSRVSVDCHPPYYYGSFVAVVMVLADVFSCPHDILTLNIDCNTLFVPTPYEDFTVSPRGEDVPEFCLEMLLEC
jgi:hypothetical protein